MPLNPPPQPDGQVGLFELCIREATLAGQSLMEDLVKDTRQLLLKQAEHQRYTQRRELVAQSLTLLEKHRAQLIRELPVQLKTHCVNEVAAVVQTRAAPGELKFEQLELMNEEQVQERVELARALQAATLEVDDQLAELNTLICAIQGFRTVQIERNPIRPEVFVKTLSQVIATTGVHAEVRMAWMQVMGTLLGKGLCNVYTRVIQLLRTRGVQAASYAIRYSDGAGARTPAAARLGESGAVVAGPVGPGAGHAGGGFAGLGAMDGRSLLTVQNLQQLVSGAFDPRTQQDRRQARSRPNSSEQWGRRKADQVHDTMPAALEALDDVGQLERLVQRLGQNIDPRLLRSESGQPRLDAVSRMGQRVSEEVVHLMVDNIADDQRLLEPLREQIRRLKAPLMALSRTDPRFFGDRQHPARQLLESITQRGLAFSEQGDSAFAGFLQPLKECVDELCRIDIEDAQAFDAARCTLNDCWDDNAAREQRRRRAAVEALLHAEQRNSLAENIAAELRQRARKGRAPVVVAQFLAGPWSQVLAEAQLRGELDPAAREALERLCEDILWTLNSRQVRGHAERLIRLIPVVLSTLRQGLRLIDYPEQDSAHFFNELVVLHRLALRTSLQPVLTPTEGALNAADSAAVDEEGPTFPPDADPAPAGPQEDPDGGESVPWLAPQEAATTGFMDEALSLPLAQSVCANATGTDMHLGDWVDMAMDSTVARLQLTWQSPQRTMFMFSGASGKTHSLTRRLLEKMLMDGRLKVVARRDVLDGALDAVAQIALNNSVERSA